MKKLLKWVLIIGVPLVVVGFFAFLYFIPPFDLLPREEFVKPYAAAVQASLQPIEDPVKRMIAERGRYIVLHSDCIGCHTPIGDQGPKWDEYLAGGLKFSWKRAGTSVSRNLTPDPETGLARRTDGQVLDVLRYGVFHDGRQMGNTQMPWAGFTNMTEEDKYAVLMYLRNIKPIWHQIPEWTPDSKDDLDSFYPYDFGKHKGQK